jgi:acetyltransferase
MIYTISRYPVHMIDVVRAADGSRITIRPTLPQDLELQRAFFRALSPHSRYCRFMTPASELPDTLAERFTNIDYGRHLALLAETYDEAGHTMVGEARYVVDDGDPTTCEFAIAVADAWQTLGIAHALLARLEGQAVAAGVRRMVADTLIANEPMRAMATRAGYSINVNREDFDLVRLEKVLAGPARTPSPHPLAA